jgi:hypothetical protein
VSERDDYADLDPPQPQRSDTIGPIAPLLVALALFGVAAGLILLSTRLHVRLNP